MRKRWIAAVAAAVMVLAPATVVSAQEEEDPPYEDPYGDDNGNFIVCYNYATGERTDDTMVYDEWGMYSGTTCPDGYTAIPIFMLP